MLHIVVTSVCVISGIHALLGIISVIVGIISSSQSEVWLAHCVSPIWSGGFFIITGVLGIFCARRKTSYVIMCFTAFSVVSMVTAVVSIQLLRLGLVNHTTDGQTFQKQNKDTLIIVALSLAGSEILVCLVSTLLSCRMAKVAKEELCKRREGMFHVKADSDENFNDVTMSSALSEINLELCGKDDIETHVIEEPKPTDNKGDSNIIELANEYSHDKSKSSDDIAIQSKEDLKDTVRNQLKLDINGKNKVQVFTVNVINDGSTSPRPET
ncbi:transmembrane protein 196-like [Dreissena polymorpha]|uniref:Transmembrane protein 196 n=1 Tax=Dreissena polymorpha TaxID=45954 RepID=A0A9D4LI81_DREPO|nr:transmembrane protein 196-like [Dreissena polymorpha]KAH3859162.1 hypothetical protein DPMN_101878 [Dreissena polymorpha]